MKDSSCICSDPLHIATKFNNFFSNLGRSFTSKVRSTQFSHKDFLVGHYANSFSLNPTTPSEIFSIVCSLKNYSKREGVDGLSMPLIYAPLSDICNLSLEHGVFPDKLKIARILPVFKSDDPKEVFEDIFNLRLLEFLTKFIITSSTVLDLITLLL